ncbi:MAG TPA: exosortase/archaeosortase family protein, partial [Gemmataceae bacterium]|nr:exosortase/archaeosortase family protein [Gemmataceae bacterium]
RPRHALFALIGLPVLLWSYWPALTQLVSHWLHEARYSHGLVVPLLALLVWWVRRREQPVTEIQSSWWGIPVLTSGAVLRLVGAYYYLDFFDGFSLLPVLWGLVLLLGGWPLCRQSAPAIGVLVFMLPWPFQVEGALSGPLQRLGTVVSTFSLQTLGLPAVSEGNIILIDNLEIGVLEACNGLGMLSAFFAISTTVALVIHRPLLDRLAVFLSAVPIGVLMNLVRLTATGLLYALVGAPAAQLFFHNLAGWLMMPLALAAVGAELYLLRRLFPVRGASGTA